MACKKKFTVIDRSLARVAKNSSIFVTIAWST